MSRVVSQALLMAKNTPNVVRAFFTPAPFSGSSPYTISGVGLGAAAPGKLVVIGVCFATALAGPVLTSATIAGVAATIIAQTSLLISGVAHDTAGFALISAVLPSAVSVSVVLNFNVSVQGEIVPWTLLNTLSSVPVDLSIATQPVAGGGTFSATIGTQNGGALICGATPVSDATSYAPSGFGSDGQGIMFSTGGSNYDYFGGSQIATLANTAAPFSLTRVGGAGSAWSGPIIAASFR